MSERSSKNTRVLGVLAPPPTDSGQISFVSRLARLQKHRAQHLHYISGAMAGSTLLPELALCTYNYIIYMIILYYAINIYIYIYIRYARSSCLFRWLYLVSLEFHVGCEAGCGLSCNDDQAYHVQFGHAHYDTFGLSQTKRKLLHISTAYCPCHNSCLKNYSIENYSLLLCCLVAHLSLVDS